MRPPILLRAGFALALTLISPMLLPQERAALNIKGVSPQLKGIIATLADNRVAVLARAPNAIYNDAGNTDTVMTYTFPAQSLSPGDMMRGTIDGLVINNTGAAIQLLFSVQAVQAGATNQLGNSGPLTVPIAGGNPNKYAAFHLSFLFAAGLPNVQGNYVPSIGSFDGSAVTSVRSTGRWPNNGFCFVGGVQGWMTDTSLSGAVVVGGPFTTGAQGSGSLAMQRAVILDVSKPTQINVVVNTTGASFAVVPLTINAGALEGL
jgi:hypothetical protein